MSMSNYANYADVIDTSFVRGIVGKELDELENILEVGGADFDEFVENEIHEDIVLLNGENESPEITRLYELWDIIKRKFEKETGLSLYLVQHDAEDRADELDGWAFAVEGVYCLTPAGKKHIDKIYRKTWTTFG